MILRNGIVKLVESTLSKVRILRAGRKLRRYRRRYKIERTNAWLYDMYKEVIKPVLCVFRTHNIQSEPRVVGG